MTHQYKNQILEQLIKQKADPEFLDKFLELQQEIKPGREKHQIKVEKKKKHDDR